MDLISIVLTLKPEPHERFSGKLPQWWGRACQTLFLQVIEQRDPVLSSKIHDSQDLRPFTTSTLMGKFPRGKIDFNTRYLLRLTAFRADISAILLSAVSEGGLLSKGSHVELDYLPFQIEHIAIASEQHTWAGITSYQDLAVDNLLDAERIEKSIKIEFASPTAFKTMGKSMPFPLPGLFFGSLLDRWNLFSPAPFPGDTRGYAEISIAVSRFTLESFAVRLKEKSIRAGCVGQVIYTVIDPDPHYQKILHVLSSFSRFSGAGVSTAMGMGQVRLLR